MRTPASNRLLLWSLALLAAGISGNLVDRIRMGRVIDFILLYYRDYQWPVFNVADTVITIGAALMAIDLFLTPEPAQATGGGQAESSLIEGAVERKNDG
jgi:lipoprotein signal peptidase